MALFENFPYTNLHELNLDWLIQEMKDLEQKVQDGPVVSVNGLTGEVILYRQPNIQFPDVNDSTVTKWEIFRYLNSHIYGIQFDSNGNVYALRDFARTKLLTWDDIPTDAGVISVNGLYGVVHLSGTDIPYMGGETETLFDKWSEMDDDINDLTVTVSTVDNAIKRGVAFLESTDTAINNIPSGRYVFWKNGAYIATSAISAGDTLSSTNLTPVATGGFINDLKDEIDTLNNKIANIGTVLTNVATKNAVECPNNGTSTVIGTITLPKGTWMLILGGWGPLGSTTVDATAISTGYPIANSTLCTRVFNLIAYAQITNSSETFNISVTNWESTSKTSETGYNVFAIKVSE